MPSGDVETYWEDGRWHIKIEGTNDSLRSCDTEAEAVEVGSGGPSDIDLDAEDVHQRDDLPQGVEVFRIAGPFFFGVAE